MSTTAKKYLFGAIAAALLASFVAGFFITHEPVEETVREPPRGEARKNPYLAAERLVERLGAQTESVYTLERPDGWSEVVVLTSPPALSPQQLDDWVAWIDEGGHLIAVVPAYASEESGSLLDELGFEPLANDFDEMFDDDMLDDDMLASEDDDDDDGEDDGAEQAKLAASPKDDDFFDGPPSRASYAFSTGFSLFWTTPEADWVVENERGSRAAASRPHGSGRVTVLGDERYLRNDLLEEGGHASFLTDAIRLPTDVHLEEGPKVTFARSTERLSWFAYVFEHTWPMFLLLGVILAFALQQGRMRFGPFVEKPSDRRRSRVEHVEATGRFLWKEGSSAALLEAAHEALLRELERHSPGISKLEPRKRNARAAELLNISHDEARRLLRSPSATSDGETFARRIRQLEEYRRRL